MATFDQAGDAVRKIAGYLPYNPGPGIYSRLEKAIEQMPANVRVQELPGLLKRYKDGVPGWELKATDLDSVIAGRDAVPREELLARVKERSPVYTTREIRLEAPRPRHIPQEIRTTALAALRENDYLGFDTLGQAAAAVREYPDWRHRWEVNDEHIAPIEAYRQWHHADDYAGRQIGGIGATEAHGPTRFHDYAEPGAKDYTELVFLQPGFGRRPAHHWHPEYPKEWAANQSVQNAAGNDAVAHMRMATHGDALRLLESQSDVLNDSIKAGDFGETKPYHMQQAQVEMDIKRLALEAARSGKRAIEIASPESISKSVGMPLEHAQHRYGKVMTSELERLGRKMGGLVEETPQGVEHTDYRSQVRGENAELAAEARMRLPPDAQHTYRMLVNAIADNLFPETIMENAKALAGELDASGRPSTNLMPSFMSLAEREAASMNAWENVRELEPLNVVKPPAKRYIMSDEMRRRILTQGIGAAVAAPMMSDDDLIERLNK